jgi:hypothetical protein
MAAQVEKSYQVNAEENGINTKQEFPSNEALDDLLPKGAVDPVYQAKAEALNAAIQEIGFGKYQVSVP